MTIYKLLKNNKFEKKVILEKLLCHRLDIPKEQLFTDIDQEVSSNDIERITSAYDQYNIEKQPLEYILGYVAFL